MKKLELKHLAPYLPYNLKVFDDYYSEIRYLAALAFSDCGIVKQLHYPSQTREYNEIKPILHPLSDLTKEIEHNGEKFVPIEWLNENKSVRLIKVINTGRYEVFSENTGTTNIRFWEYCIIEKLFEWHFDVFGLIKDGLAIDINTIKQ